MKAIIIGAGRIGRGFVTELLLNNNIEVVFFEAVKEMVDELNKIGHYTIHVLGDESKNTSVNNVRAFEIDDVANLAKEWEDSRFIFTAVGGKNMKAIGEKIADAFSLLCTQNKVIKSDIITCENWVDPGKELEDAIYENLSEKEKEMFIASIGVSESVVMATGTGAPEGSRLDTPLDTYVQNMWYLPIDKDRIKNEIPNIKFLTFVENFNNLLKQKLYTNNTSVASIAFLGNLLGHKYVAEAANDARIEPILDEVYNEINQALVKGMGINEEDQIAFSKRAKNKYQDRDIIDVISRIARDPIRKLKPSDRLIGPAKIALSVGVKPDAIAMATAAALFYKNETDESAVKLKEMREEKGIRYILENVCELNENDELYQLILEKVEYLKKEGWL